MRFRIHYNCTLAGGYRVRKGEKEVDPAEQSELAALLQAASGGGMVERLDESTPVKEVPKDEEPAEVPTLPADFDKLKKADLLELADKVGASASKEDTNAEIREAILARVQEE